MKITKDQLRQIIREEIQTMKQIVNEVKLKVDMSNFMRSAETAYILVTSPTGKKITIMKHKALRFSPEQSKVWKKLVSGETEFTSDEMKTMLTMSGY